jgi:riboflavin kinase / FMN adenylyltransferase
MQHFYSLDELKLDNCWLTIGVFDGVHRGHQVILRRLIDGAHAAGVPAVVLTFSPHPAVVLGHTDLKCLTMPDERAEQLGALGVDFVITHPFDKNVASLTALEFMTRLKQRLGLTRLLIGYDFALGKGREGTASRLSEIGRELGYEVAVVEAVSDETGVISSSSIRKLIAVGKVAEAADMLGHDYVLSGPVIHGDARGHKLGFPTANIAVPTEKALPANGIYSCWAVMDGQRYRAAISIGIRPTFENTASEVRVEAYLLDYDHDLYGKFLELEFVARLRDELKFSSVDALIAQINDDVEKTREILK